LSEGLDVVEAARFGCAVAGISVTRHGTAPSMPKRQEVMELMALAKRSPSE
jgi:ribokinase